LAATIGSFIQQTGTASRAVEAVARGVNRPMSVRRAKIGVRSVDLSASADSVRPDPSRGLGAFVAFPCEAPKFLNQHGVRIEGAEHPKENSSANGKQPLAGLDRKGGL
jgi:hypothetical protein